MPKPMSSGPAGGWGAFMRHILRETGGRPGAPAGLRVRGSRPGVLLGLGVLFLAAEALDRGLSVIRGNLDRQVKKGTIPAEAPAEILGRITKETTLDACKRLHTTRAQNSQVTSLTGFSSTGGAQSARGHAPCSGDMSMASRHAQRGCLIRRVNSGELGAFL